MPPRTEINPLSIVVAVDKYGGFAKNKKIPWHYPEDLQHFKTLTNGGVCVMGKYTYAEMLEMRKKKGMKPEDIEQILPGRDSYVLTNTKDLETPGAKTVQSLYGVVGDLDEQDKRTIYAIGGLPVFIEAMSWADQIFMTIIKRAYKCDTFFPLEAINKNYKIVDGSETRDLYFVTYNRVRNNKHGTPHNFRKVWPGNVQHPGTRNGS